MDSDFEDFGDYIQITFRKSKNDQYYKGSTSVIAKQLDSTTCPVKLIRLYFKHFGLKFKGKGDKGVFVNFRVRNKVDTTWLCQVPG